MAGLSLRRRLALELYVKQRKLHRQEHPLRQLFWECTHRCNLSCRHCGSDCKSTVDHPDMPKEDFLRVIDSLTPHVDNHRLNIIITGGEPLMRKDLEEVGRELYKREYPWGMVTNGLALTPSRFDSLLRAGLHGMTISLDGLEEDHNWMRGNKLSFDRAVAAIRMAAAEPSIKFDVVTCVNPRSLDSLEKIKELLIECGVKAWRLFTVFPAGRAKAEDFELSKEEFHRLMKFIIDTRKEGRIKASYCCEGFLGNYEGDVRDHFYSCEAGVSVGSVLIDGSIGACPSIRADYSQGNIYKDDFFDVWENRYQVYRDRSWMRRGKCADCNMFRYCEGNGMHLRDSEGNLMHCNLPEK
ncbi:MAG: radical SAM protein [Bacteroides sp.]|nr:radical SAM protein [Bacteroides sp.]